MTSNIPKIAPIKLTEYELKQSKYSMVPKLPCRSILVGPSGSGKSVLLTNLILDIYRGCFSRIYIFSVHQLMLIQLGYQLRNILKKN
jgi:DNA replication protein DnaC